MTPAEVGPLAWALYALGVGLLLSAAAWSISASLRRLRLPTRWVWGSALVLSLALPASAFFFPAALGPWDRSGQADSAASVPGAEVEDAILASQSVIDGAVREAAVRSWAPALLVETSSWLNGMLAKGARALPSTPEARRWTTAGWAAASVALALLFVVSALRMRRRRQRWPMSVLIGRTVRVTPDLGPAVSGVRRPEILLPAWALTLEEDALELILRHEEEHLQARDPLLLTAALGLVTLVPWNPFLWWQFRRLREAVEVDCDRRVMARGAAPAIYGRLLLDMGTRARHGELLPALGMSGPTSVFQVAMSHSTSLLERRLNAMKKQSPRKALPLALMGALVGVGLLVLACEADTPTHLSDDVASAEAVAADQPTEAGTAQAESPAEARGQTARINIRGAGNLSSDSGNPLVVLDGVPVRSTLPESGGTIRGAADEEEGSVTLEGLNLEARNIESIEVLKGEAATVQYGEEGRDGVILITTRSSDGPVPGVEEGSGRDIPSSPESDTNPAEADPARYLELEVYRNDGSERLGLDVQQHTGSSVPASGSDVSPLYIIDGVIVGSSSVPDLDPDRIESIEVVKGEAAGKLYGSRAADGVIIVTTKGRDG